MNMRCIDIKTFNHLQGGREIDKGGRGSLAFNRVLAFDFFLVGLAYDLRLRVLFGSLPYCLDSSTSLYVFFLPAKGRERCVVTPGS